MFHVPERWFPGKFDIWGQSHQLFHILVLIAAFVSYYGISVLEGHHTLDMSNNNVCAENILF
jgi:predicted membrane channel-forming protein YqfA (hemolysin III family)